MTVCIGALCENGAAVVAAADKLVTFGPPVSLQTEPPVFTKIFNLGDNAVILFSGNVPDGEEIISTAVIRLATAGRQPVAIMAEQVRVAYAEYKQKRQEETILRQILGTDFDGYRLLVQQSPASIVLQNAMMLLQQHNLNTDLLIAGADDLGHHLYLVTHPGSVLSLDTLGYVAIGSGGTHASIRLSLDGYTKTASVADTVMSVYKAKKAAEVSPGVGKGTDLVIIKDGKIRHASPHLFATLESHIKPHPTLSEADRKAIDKACNDHVA